MVAPFLELDPELEIAVVLASHYRRLATMSMPA
jgi:hypothetical protein